MSWRLIVRREARSELAEAIDWYRSQHPDFGDRFLRAFLEASGKKVHVLTSPHLVRFNERIVLAGAEISDASFIEAIGEVDRAAGDDDLTLFETITCAAFLRFAQSPADYLVLEVGLGGRLDATNVIERLLAAVITPIALDHMNFLGETIAAIAHEKAGIFRRGAPAVAHREERDLRPLE